METAVIKELNVNIKGAILNSNNSKEHQMKMITDNIKEKMNSDYRRQTILTPYEVNIII